MWSGPRNISTALMRSFENRPDCAVSDEPFYCHYLYKTGIDHPMRDKIIENGNSDWNSIVSEITGSIPDGKEVWYQKHMAHHNLPGYNLEWTQKLTNCILIRHPKDVILSYLEKYEIESAKQLGYDQQLELLHLLINLDAPFLVLDASDVLKNPEGMLKLICKKLSIPFYIEMLSWPPGRRKNDGIWGKHWYGSVEDSTCFQSYVEKMGNLLPKHQDIYSTCLESYKELYLYRIQ